MSRVSKIITPRAPNRRAFTLVELLVVISVMGMLLAIAVPAISRARENGRDAVCRSNLRQLGIGLMQYADSHNTLCSGAFDWKHDGCVTETGWVADLVSSGIPVGKLLCPSNPQQLNEQYFQLLGFEPNGNTCADSLGPTNRYVDGKRVDNICRLLSGQSPDDRVPLLEQLLEDGFNTNYVATWYLTRSDVRLDIEGNLTGGGDCPTSLMNRASTMGPFNKNRIGISALKSETIPLLGCANVANASNGFLQSGVGIYSVGTQLTESTTNGPVDPSTMRVPIMPGGAGMATWVPYWNKTLQDYRDFGPVHGGRRGGCNILFLDGGVRQFVDLNGDGFLNNGFTPSPTNGFDSGEIELPAAQVYSGYSTNPALIPRR